MAASELDTSTNRACSNCELEHSVPKLEVQEIARCRNCGTVMATGTGKLSPLHATALSLTGAICWALALYLPLTRVEKLGLTSDGRLLGIGSGFREHGQNLLAITADLLAIALPSCIFFALPVVALSRLTGRSFLGRSFVLKTCSIAKKWAMPEVFALSILIAFIKLGDLAEASIKIGFYFLLVAVGLLTYLLQRIPLPPLQHRKSSSSAWALLVAAGILLLPANLLPIMDVVKVGELHRNTILGGVAELFADGLWGIATIVFTASILVPFAKIGGLAWLLLIANKKTGSRQTLKTYNYLEFIGRWSMLDIFLIAVLAQLIDFGKLSSVSPGPAATPFAASVILTILAFERFSTRSLFTKSSKSQLT